MPKMATLLNSFLQEKKTLEGSSQTLSRICAHSSTAKELLHKYPELIILPSTDTSEDLKESESIHANRIPIIYGHAFESLIGILWSLLDSELRTQVIVTPDNPDLSHRIVDFMTGNSLPIEVKTGRIATGPNSQNAGFRDKFPIISYIVPFQNSEETRKKLEKKHEASGKSVIVLTLNDIIQELPCKELFENQPLIQALSSRKAFTNHLIQNGLEIERMLYSAMIYLLNYPQPPEQTAFLMQCIFNNTLADEAPTHFPELMILSQRDYQSIKLKFTSNQTPSNN